MEINTQAIAINCIQMIYSYYYCYYHHKCCFKSAFHWWPFMVFQVIAMNREECSL